jgi:hypothetical protein
MNDGDHRHGIARLEEQIDELAARIESCRKFILAGKIAVAGGGVVLIAMLVGGIQFDPSVMAIAIAAVLGGIVVAGSSHSTAKEATHELSAADATALIGQIDLRLVPSLARRLTMKISHIVGWHAAKYHVVKFYLGGQRRDLIICGCDARDREKVICGPMNQFKGPCAV